MPEALANDYTHFNFRVQC